MDEYAPLDDNDEVLLLDSPVHDAGDLVEDEVDENDVETEQIVLLDMLRLDDLDFA